MNTSIRLLLFAVICLISVVLFSLLVNRGFKKFQLSKALLWISAVAMIGVLGEIFVDTIYNHFFHAPLWRYNFLQVHHAYTSGYSPILWGTFGFYLYLIHHSMEKWTRSQLVSLSLIFAVEALLIEALADLASKPILGDYIYYYYPANLWHITAFQCFPFYFLTGVLIAQTIHWFKASPHFFTVLSSWVTVITVYFK